MTPRTVRRRSAAQLRVRAGARLRHAIVGAAVGALLAACGVSTGTRESWPSGPGRSSRPLPGPPQTGAPVPLPSPDYPPAPASIPPDAPRSAEEMSGPAVQSLIAQARDEQAAGRAGQAIAALERALRIEPRNAFVWQMLGSSHLALGQMEQAEGTAQKSNSLARGNPYVELGNWKTIAAVRQAAGDSQGALQAQMRVDELQRLLESR